MFYLQYVQRDYQFQYSVGGYHRSLSRSRPGFESLYRNNFYRSKVEILLLLPYLDTGAVYLKYEKGFNGTVDTRRRMDEEGGNTTKSQDGDKLATEEKPTIVKLNIDLDRANSKGVIVDSGTMESYFPTHMNYPFQEAFQTLMGFGFKSMVLGSSGIIPEIDYPTILIQLWAAPNVEDDGLMDENGVPLAGVAGEIDLYNPNDVFVSSHVVEKSSLASLSPRYTKMEGFNIVMLLKDSGEIDISHRGKRRALQ